MSSLLGLGIEQSAQATPIQIIGLPAVGYSGVPFKFTVKGTAADSCVESSPGGKLTPFTLSALGTTVTHIPGTTTGLYSFTINCTNSGSTSFTVQVLASSGNTSLPTPAPIQTPPSMSGREITTANNGIIKATIWPIYYPLTIGYKDCPYTSVKIEKTDGTNFIDGENIEIQAGSQFIPQPSGSRFDGIISDVNRQRFAMATPWTKRMPNALTGIIYFCGDQNNQPSKLSSPTLVNALITLNNLATVESTLTLPFYVLPKSDEITQIDNVRTQCGFTWMQTKFDQNLVLEQTKKPGKLGGITTFKGTLYRQGLLASFDTIEVRAQGSTVLELGELLGKATTDASGQFTITFPAKKSQFSDFPMYDFMIPERSEPIGIFSGPFEAYSFNVSLQMPKQGLYEKTLEDWIPQFPSGCTAAYSKYQSSYGASSTELFHDDRHPIAMYVTKKVLYGFKNKATYPSVSASGSSSGGGRCHVSGYTTKTGKRVSSYSRSC